MDGWNRLSDEVVSAQTIRSFNRRLDGLMDGDEKWMQVYKRVLDQQEL